MKILFTKLFTLTILLCSTAIYASEQTLPIPPILNNYATDDKGIYLSLNVQQGVTEFIPGAANKTYGYNGSLLGPTIRVRRGEKVRIKVTNNLREHTTVHWHGLLVPGDQDGGPHQVIKPDSQWTAEFVVDQPAATAWYHPHGIGNTASQVYKGLAGLFIIDEDETDKLNLPSNYGVNDIPIIVQDRRFAKDGTMVYLTSMTDIMQGMTGNTILVNGVINPVLTVPAGLVRLRILNGSNSRFYNFSLSNKQKFHQIATDGGLLEKPAELNSLILSPGERAEIIADFSKFKTGESLKLIDGSKQILKIVFDGKSKASTELPKKLTVIDKNSVNNPKKERDFTLQGMGHMVSINGKRMNMNRIDEKISVGSKELWSIKSNLGMMGMMHRMASNVLHNFHAHGTQFLILERNGSTPPANERGWKDTFFVRDDETVTIAAKFPHKGIFMYHCHILEHEDNGMMGQFLVE